MLILAAAIFVGLLSILLTPPQGLFTKALAPVICPGAVYAVDTPQKMVALTLDDGPDLRLGEASSTRKMLEVLRLHNQKEPDFTAHATFFLLSNQISDRERLLGDRLDDTVVRIVAEGHEIGNHMAEDGPSILLGDRFSQAFETTHQQLTAYAQLPDSQYPQVRWFRPGVGWCDRAMADTVRQQAEYRSRDGFPNIALGSVWPYDTLLAWPTFSHWFIRHNIRPGSIIILHDGGSRGDRTAQILEGLLPELAKMEYKVVPLAELLRNGNVVARSQAFPKPVEAIRTSIVVGLEKLRLRFSDKEG